jgi:hypothetical protein
MFEKNFSSSTFLVPELAVLGTEKVLALNLWWRGIGFRGATCQMF